MKDVEAIFFLLPKTFTVAAGRRNSLRGSKNNFVTIGL